jgi:hypothetical protein
MAGGHASRAAPAAQARLIHVHQIGDHDQRAAAQAGLPTAALICRSDLMTRGSPLFFVQVQGDLINTVSVHTDRSGTAVVTLAYGTTLTLRMTGAVPALRYLARDLARQLDQLADTDMRHPPVVDGASLVTDRRSDR